MDTQNEQSFRAQDIRNEIERCGHRDADDSASDGTCWNPDNGTLLRCERRSADEGCEFNLKYIFKSLKGYCHVGHNLKFQYENVRLYH